MSIGPSRERGKRPFGVWLVLTYEVCVALLSVGGSILASKGFFPQNSAQRIYHEHLRTLDHVLIGIPEPIDLAATIFLFYLRKLAVPLKALALGLTLASMVRLALTSNWLEALGAGRTVVIFAVTIDLVILI